MPLAIRTAQKSKSKLRIGFAGPSGSGKTYSALLLASGIAPWVKICVIDTENMSADLYSDLGAYNVITITPPFAPSAYVEAIRAAEDAGMEVIIIDSITHEWSGEGGALDIQTKMGGRFQDWAKVTPLHEKFKQALLQSKAHIITTVRSKMDYMMTDDGGKSKVQKVGLKQETREGFEYELTLSFDLNINHLATASKDRTGLFMDGEPVMITKDTGKRLLAWANTGADPKTLINDIDTLLLTKQTTQTLTSLCAALRVTALADAPYGQLLSVRTKLMALPDRKSPDEPPAAPPDPGTPGDGEQVASPVEETPVVPVAEAADIPMATVGQIAVYKQLIQRRAQQVGKAHEHLTVTFLERMKVNKLEELTKKQIGEINDILAKLNAEAEPKPEIKPAEPSVEENTADIAESVFLPPPVKETKKKSKK